MMLTTNKNSKKGYTPRKESIRKPEFQNDIPLGISSVQLYQAMSATSHEIEKCNMFCPNQMDVQGICPPNMLCAVQLRSRSMDFSGSGNRW